MFREQAASPGRFAGLGEQFLALIKLYRYTSGEAWAYYGDLDAAHLSEVERGLNEGAAERARLGGLLERLDFRQSAAQAEREPDQEGPAGDPTPTQNPGLPEWEP